MGIMIITFSTQFQQMVHYLLRGQNSTVLYLGQSMKKLQQKNRDVTGPLTGPWKSPEDIRRAQDKTVPDLIEEHMKLEE